MKYLKAWSLFDFLLQTDHAKLKEFFRFEAEITRNEETDYFCEKGLKKIYGWTPEDLDAHWREWVLQTY